MKAEPVPQPDYLYQASAFGPGRNQSAVDPAARLHQQEASLRSLTDQPLALSAALVFTTTSHGNLHHKLRANCAFADFEGSSFYRTRNITPRSIVNMGRG